MQERCQVLERRVEQVTEDGIATAQKVDSLEVLVHQLGQEVDRLRADRASMDADLATIRAAAASSAALEQRVEVMSTQINETRTRLDAAPTVHEASSSRSSIASTASASPALETRTSAILMNLLEPFVHGTPLTDEERKARMERCFTKGKEVLLQCGVVESTYSQLASMPNGKGCNLEFTSHAALQHARSQVLATSLSFGMSGTRRIMVWLDVGETRDELRPPRMTHRCHEVMTDVEAEKGEDARAVIKCLRGKFVSIGIPSKRIGYSLSGTWRWTAFAMGRYAEEDLNMASAFIEGN